MADQALRSATRAAREVAAGAYASLDLCPWCHKGLGKVIPRAAFCPSCHRDVLTWNQGKEEERESQQKGVHASQMAEKTAKEAELLRKIREEGMVNKTKNKKATNRE